VATHNTRSPRFSRIADQQPASNNSKENKATEPTPINAVKTCGIYPMLVGGVSVPHSLLTFAMSGRRRQYAMPTIIATAPNGIQRVLDSQRNLRPSDQPAKIVSDASNNTRNATV